MITFFLKIFNSSFFLEHFYLQQFCFFFFILLFSLFVFFLFSRIVIPSVVKVLEKTKVSWDDHFINSGLLKDIPFLLSCYTIHEFSFYLSVGGPSLKKIILLSVTIYVIFIFQRLINYFYRIYENISFFRKISGSRSWIQLIKLFLFILGGIVFLSILLGKSPLVFLSGLGAMTAVLLLIFKDTILSLIATLQMTLYDTIRVSDWIEMKEYEADGDVISINLHTVQIKNWDKTIVNIPTQKFLDNSFKNWRGMYQSGGRRIKKCLYIDMNSIQFVTSEMLEYFKSFPPLKDYLLEKERIFDEYNTCSGVNISEETDRKILTNLGIFRAYIRHYLYNHPRINEKMSFLVRTLNPSEKGLPLEIYVFTNETDWSPYEEIQSDIFEYFLAIVPKFSLKIFQNPTGDDWKTLKS